MKKMDKKAFTLIELLVVIAVIGILVLLAAPRFTGYTQKAERIRIQHDTKAMEEEIGTVLINGDDEFNEWENNMKDYLNQLAQDNELFEKEGLVANDKPIDGTYKVIPEEYKDKINTKLKGTFYANSHGKVYYEHGQGPGYSDEEIEDLVKIGFIPVATADELNNVRYDKPNLFGKGTKWVGLYTGGLDKKYIQVKDIDLSGYSEGEGWTPIGTNLASSFKGTYDGGNYVITDLEIKGADKDNQGLFGFTEGATISNVRLINNKIKVTGESNYVGGLVGRAYSGTTISNSYATGSVEGQYGVGGLVGDAFYGNTIENSYATGSVKGAGIGTGGLVGEAGSSTIENSYATVTVTGKQSVGGLVGLSGTGTISNSYATGPVTGSGMNVGGLVGNDEESTINNSYATGEVSGGSRSGGLVGYASKTKISSSYSIGAVTSIGDEVGGLVGYANTDVTISNSYATGQVTGRNQVGGLVGKATNSSTISNSYFTGSVKGDWIVGGLVGDAGSSTKISNSYATGPVEVTRRNYAGGLVGSASFGTKIINSYSTGAVKGLGDNIGGLVGSASSVIIENSYATGSVTVSGQSWNVGGLVGLARKSTIEKSYATGEVTGLYDVGGLVGKAEESTISNSYWDKETTGKSTSAGQDDSFGKSTVKMKLKDTYLGWGFKETWKIDEGVSYPTLINNPEGH